MSNTRGLLAVILGCSLLVLLEPDPRAQSFACPANAVAGHFFVPVHLEASYRGQRLVDPVTGRAHRLTRRSDL